MELTRIASLGGSVWLKQWSEANDEAGTNHDVGMYIGIYFAFGVGSAALVVIQTLILWIFCSIEVSANVLVLVQMAIPASYTWLHRLSGSGELTRGLAGQPQVTPEHGMVRPNSISTISR